MIIEIDGHDFDATFEEEHSPMTCEAFRAAMPFTGDVVHVRWSGEAVWIPLGDLDFAVGYEDATAYPERLWCRALCFQGRNPGGQPLCDDHFRSWASSRNRDVDTAGREKARAIPRVVSVRQAPAPL